MMEKLLGSLKSDFAMWLSPSVTPWVADVIFAVLCGLGLSFLLFPLLVFVVYKAIPPSPPPRKGRNSKKRPVEPRWNSRKKNRALKACRDCLQDLDETRDLLSLLQSHLVRPPDQGSSRPPSCQDPLGEASEAAPAGDHQPCREPVGGAAPTVSPSASPAPPTEHLSPRVSALSPGATTSSASTRPHAPQRALQPPEPSLPLDGLSPRPLSPSPCPPCPPDSEAPPPPPASSGPPPPEFTLPLAPRDSVEPPSGTVPPGSSPHPPRPASPIPATSSLDHPGRPVLALSWWQAAAKALRSSQCSSQQEHLSHHPPEAALWGHPTDRRVQAESLSLLSSDDQRVLEIQLTKRVQIKVWGENDSSYPTQRSPDYHLHSLGHVLKSLNAGQNTEPPWPSWGAGDKPAQPGTQRLSHPKVAGDPLQQKCNQLFWGLPSLHSESLVAPSWIAGNPPSLQSPILFNQVPRACVQTQAQVQASPPLARSQTLSHGDSQSQRLIPTMRQVQASSLAQARTQAHLRSSRPILPPSSAPQMGAAGESCPTAQNRPPSLIANESQDPEWPVWQKPLESGRASSPVDQRPREVFSDSTCNLPEDSREDSILPEYFPISPDFRQQLEQHMQKWLVQHRWQSPQETQEPRALRPLQGESAGMREAPGRCGSSQPSSFTGDSSQDALDGGSQPSQDTGRGLGPAPGKVPRDPSGVSRRSLVMFDGTDSEESETELMLLRSHSERGVLRRLGQNLENLLQVHLDRKLGQISQGWIPLAVRRSWLAVNYALATSDTHLDTGNLGTVKGRKLQVNTAHTVPFLNLDTQEVLEAHVTRLGVRHKWGLPLKVLQPVKVFRLKRAASPIQHVTFLSSAAGASGAHSDGELAQFPEKPPQAPPGEKALEEPGPNLARPLPGPSSVREETRGAPRGAPLHDDHGPSKAALTRQEGRPPAQSLTLTYQNETVEWTKRGRLQPNSSSTKARNQPRRKNRGPAPPDPRLKMMTQEKNVDSQCLAAQGAREAVLASVVLKTDVSTQSENTHVWRLEPTGASQAPGSVLQDPGETGLHTEALSKLAARGKAQSESQPQDWAACNPPPADPWAAPGPRCDRVTAAIGAASWGLCGLVAAQRSSPGQQGLSELQCAGKNRGPTCRRDGSRWPNADAGAEELERLRTFPADRMNPSARARGTVYCVERKCLWQRPEKKPDPPDGFLHRLKLFLQGIFPLKRLQGQEALQKCKPRPAEAQSPGRIRGKDAECRALMTAMERLIEKKVATPCRRCPPHVKERTQEPRAPVCGGFCSNRLPFRPEQGLTVGHAACSHLAHRNDQGSSIHEQQGLGHFLSLTPKKTQRQASLCPCGPRMPGVPGL